MQPYSPVAGDPYAGRVYTYTNIIIRYDGLEHKTAWPGGVYELPTTCARSRRLRGSLTGHADTVYAYSARWRVNQARDKRRAHSRTHATRRVMIITYNTL